MDAATPSKRTRGLAGSSKASPAKSSPGSSKKPKIGALQKSKTNIVETKPGVASNTKSYLHKPWERERECAANMQYKYIDDFRRFVISPFVLKHYNKMGRDDRTKARMDGVLDVLRDCAKDMVREDDPAVVYPREHERNVEFQVALIVAQAKRDIEEAQSEGRTFTQDDVEKHCADAEKHLKRVISCLNASTDKAVFPKFGPFTSSKEDELKAYAHVFALLRYVGHSSNAAVWPGRYGAVQWDLRKAIGDSHVPYWMLPKEDDGALPAPDHPLTPSGPSAPEKPAIKIKINRKYDAKIEEAEEYRDIVEQLGLADLLPKLSQEITIEPALRWEHFLDKVRRTYEMQKIKAQIHSLRLELDGDEFQHEFDLMTDDWSDIKDALWTDGWDPAAEDEIIYQCPVPFAVEQMFGVVDGDISRLAPTANDGALESGVSDRTEKFITAIQEKLRERKVPNPAKLFANRHDDMVKFYDGYDPTTSEGLSAWQRKAFNAVTKGDNFRKTKNNADFETRKVKLDTSERQALVDARLEGKQTMFSLAEANRKEDEKEAQYYSLNQLHTGTSTQVGLPLNPCAKALQLEAFRNEKGKLMYRSQDLDLRTCPFYPWQVTGACTALVGAIGYVPVKDDAPDDVKEAAESLKGLAIGGKLICDQTGLGKTILLLANYYYSKAHIETDSDGKPLYRIMVLVVPAGVIKQWADEILDKLPGLRLMISYDESGLPATKYKPHFISATALKGQACSDQSCQQSSDGQIDYWIRTDRDPYVVF